MIDAMARTQPEHEAVLRHRRRGTFAAPTQTTLSRCARAAAAAGRAGAASAASAAGSARSARIAAAHATAAARARRAAARAALAAGGGTENRAAFEAIAARDEAGAEREGEGDEAKTSHPR